MSVKNRSQLVTKRATLIIGGDGSSGGFLSPGTSVCMRIPFQNTVTTWRRYRLKFRNRIYATQTDGGAGTYDLKGIAMGRPHFPEPMDYWNADFAEAPATIQTEIAAFDNATEWVGPWVTDPALMPPRNALRALSIGLVNGSSLGMAHSPYNVCQLGINSVSSQWAATTFNNGGFATTQQVSFGDWRIEYEWETPRKGGTPIVMIAASDSIMAGTSDDPAGLSRYQYQNASTIAAARNGYACVNLAIAGTGLANWASWDVTNPVWTRAGLGQGASTPDAAIIEGGTTEIGASTIDTIRQNELTVIQTLKQLGVRQIYLCTVPPKNLPEPAMGGTGWNFEQARRQFNAWRRSEPYGTHCIDLDAVLRDPQCPTRMRPDLCSGPQLHPSLAGHIQMASVLPKASDLDPQYH